MGKVDNIKHCEKRLPLKWRSFWERSNFTRIWFRDLRFIEFEVSKSSIWKHTTSSDKGVFFLSLLSRNSDDQSSSNFHRLVIFCICWDTPSETTGLWQLPNVSSVFNPKQFCDIIANSMIMWSWPPSFKHTEIKCDLILLDVVLNTVASHQNQHTVRAPI